MGLIRTTLITYTVDVPEADIRQALTRDPAKSGQAQIPAPTPPEPPFPAP